MKTLKTLYYVNENKHNSFIKAELYYDKGGYSVFSGKMCPRAYWMSVHEVKRDGVFESVQVFNNGCKKLLHEVGRQSKKWDNLSLEDFDKNIDNFVKHVYPDLSLTKESEVA